MSDKPVPAPPSALAAADPVAAETALASASAGRGFAWQPVAAFAALAVLWQIASFFSPPYLFPSLVKVGGSFFDIMTTWDLLYQGLVTWARLTVAVVGALVIGIPLGLAMGLSPQIDELARPVVKFIMGIPSLNWVIIVIIWFSATEVRIAFVLLMICTPISVFCIYDGVRSIDPKLRDMVLSFGAGRLQLVGLLLWPYVKAFAFTATKLNIGIAVRTVIVAELVGASSGIGKELDLAKNLFDMPAVLAWTLWMVLMLLVMQRLVEWLERAVLRWRADEKGRV
jgi:ABC-type nitrate/sulfonate/bicarbonate transport system permease component